MAKNLEIQNNPNTENTDNMVEVLYQKMGNRWFAFSLVGDEVYMGSISQDAVETPAVGDTDDTGKGFPRA